MGGLKRTPLYDIHVSSGARMVGFGGWEMPVYYQGIIEEHRIVRESAGLFDISHMGEIEVNGPGALSLVQRITTNNAGTLKVGQVQYSLICNPEGGILDDILVYRLGADKELTQARTQAREERYLLVVNASNTERDYEWVLSHQHDWVGRVIDAEIIDRTDEVALLALQGPKAEAILSRLTNLDLSRLCYYWCTHGEVAGVPCLVSRTGYTGEDGFELYLEAAYAERLWRAILEAGAGDGVAPVGLGARDTLRLEMGYPLYGHEIDEETNPYEAGLGWVVKLDKEGFIGREALARIKGQGLRRKLIGFELLERAVPRMGCEILLDGREIGFVTSGTMSPTLGKGIGLGYVPIENSVARTELNILIRGKEVRARVVPVPFVKSRVRKG